MPGYAALVVAVILFVAAAALGAVAVLSLREELPRNRWAGVRTPASLVSDEAFRAANKAAALPILAGGLFLALGAVAVLSMNGLLRPIAVLMCVVATLLAVGAGGALGSRAAAATPGCAPQRCSTCTGCALSEASG